MLSVQNLSKSYGLNTVLKNISFCLNWGERAALVGPNGCGKSTLMSIIARQETPDIGHVAFTPADLRVGYLQQGIRFDTDQTMGSYLIRFAADLKEALHTLEQSGAAIAASPGDPERIAAYEKALKVLQRAQEMEGTRKSVLSGFDLIRLPQDTPIHTLSGGQKVRLALAGVLLEAPQMLLLDEPTNHLDLDMHA